LQIAVTVGTKRDDSLLPTIPASPTANDAVTNSSPHNPRTLLGHKLFLKLSIVYQLISKCVVKYLLTLHKTFISIYCTKFVFL
jgi:hypothetical protein